MKGSDQSAAVLNWGTVLPGDLVKVLANGESYLASVEMKTAQSDIIWVRRHGLGTRHLLDRIDGVQLHAPTNSTNFQG